MTLGTGETTCMDIDKLSFMTMIREGKRPVA